MEKVAESVTPATEEIIGTIEFQLPATTAEFERQLASMKHIPPAAAPPALRIRIPATLRIPATSLPPVSLPPVVVTRDQDNPPKRHQFIASYDKFSDKDFYSDFTFTFVSLPEPRDALPRKSRGGRRAAAAQRDTKLTCA